MKDYTNVDPSFSETIKIPETTDPAHADDVINPPLKKLQDNTLWLKKHMSEGVSCDTVANVTAMAIELMGTDPPDPSGETATDEEVEEMIEHLDDL